MGVPSASSSSSVLGKKFWKSASACHLLAFLNSTQTSTRWFVVPSESTPSNAFNSPLRLSVFRSLMPSRSRSRNSCAHAGVCEGEGEGEDLLGKGLDHEQGIIDLQYSSRAAGCRRLLGRARRNTARRGGKSAGGTSTTWTRTTDEPVIDDEFLWVEERLVPASPRFGFWAAVEAWGGDEPTSHRLCRLAWDFLVEHDRYPRSVSHNDRLPAVSEPVRLAHSEAEAYGEAAVVANNGLRAAGA
ncbi:hypothetical protein B0H14DRAFT_3522108 [Mycena olivaceomarginata]|nr:hypothetical protein B0H14DRAFT_3522108 [Mycena olivaceomarginata]